ncbi:hypothetical protein PTI97_02555 [Exiguobacterium marinum]|uniref:N-acetyltransferase domain-containing protein n=1 Tax=Exiguobacterium marinum TaxID=273528 RepID=A0ABY7WZW5_9BACL|nr:hypothetical protein [Exiguobacterium marinum]WDH76421.1 hypothetical protein PTI97_02555 [Exiguobacterium marinum]
MKRALRFVECRQLPLHERTSIQSLYPFSQAPLLLSLPSHHHVYVALNEHTPLASVVANDEHLEEFQIIQLSKSAYDDRHVFRGLLNRILYERSRETKHMITYYLYENDYHNQDKLRIYEASGFQKYHQTTTYHLPLLPCEKGSHTYWTLDLIDYSRRNEWIEFRNTSYYVLPEAVPMTDQQFTNEMRQHTLFYILRWCHRPIGIMKVRLRMYHVFVQEIHLECDEPFVREAISFLQQKFFYKLRYIEEAHISTTNLQTDLTFALQKHGAQASSVSGLTYTQQVPPTPLYS